MDRLKARFGEQIEFVSLNVDDSASLPLRQQYDIVARSQYILADATGATQFRWFGYLDENAVAEQLDGFPG